MPDSGGQTNVQISGKAALFVGKHGSATVMLGHVFKPTQTALLGQDQGCECVKGGPKWPAWLAPRAMAGRLLGTQSGFENRPYHYLGILGGLRRCLPSALGGCDAGRW